ncbi:MAG: hypothetical protein QM661_12760 [Solimonas sp.]
MRRIVITSALLLAACAAPRYRPAPVVVPTGVAVGTIASDGHCTGYTLYVADRASGKTYGIEQNRDLVDKLVPLFAEREARAEIVAHGVPFAVEMPAGSYTLKGWQLNCGSAVILSQAPPAIRFDVTPNQSVYLGSYQFSETTHIGTVLTGASVTLREQAARDLPAIHAAFPEPSTYQVAQRLAPGTVIENVGAAGTPADGASFITAESPPAPE